MHKCYDSSFKKEKKKIPPVILKQYRRWNLMFEGRKREKRGSSGWNYILVFYWPTWQQIHLSLFLTRPTIIASPAILIDVAAVQSWVSSMNIRGLSTYPWGTPMLSVVVLDVVLPTRIARGPVANHRETCTGPTSPVSGSVIVGWWCQLWLVCFFHGMKCRKLKLA